jgi:hypothetical protein
VLAAHAGVATTAEPWILLPFLSPLTQHVPGAGGRHDRIYEAFEDFTGQLPEGPDRYRQDLREFALQLYSGAAGDGAHLFVDKSPPYYLVVDELMRTFPDGKFVFLWRDPLAVLASIVETFYGGTWKTPPALFSGLASLTRAYAENRDRSFCVRYEDLVQGEQPWLDLSRYIGLDFDPQTLEKLSEGRPAGRLGDPTGINLYDKLSDEPLKKWRRVVHNPVRREWSRRYLRWIGAERLALMGYDLDGLLRDLDESPSDLSGVAADSASIATLAVRELVKARLGRTAGEASITRLLAG